MLIISPLYTFYQRMNEKPATRKQFCLSGLQDLYIWGFEGFRVCCLRVLALRRDLSMPKDMQERTRAKRRDCIAVWRSSILTPPKKNSKDSCKYAFCYFNDRYHYHTPIYIYKISRIPATALGLGFLVDNHSWVWGAQSVGDILRCFLFMHPPVKYRSPCRSDSYDELHLKVATLYCYQTCLMILKALDICPVHWCSLCFLCLFNVKFGPRHCLFSRWSLLDELPKAHVHFTWSTPFTICPPRGRCCTDAWIVLVCVVSDSNLPCWWVLKVAALISWLQKKHILLHSNSGEERGISMIIGQTWWNGATLRGGTPSVIARHSLIHVLERKFVARGMIWHDVCHEVEYGAC